MIVFPLFLKAISVDNHRNSNSVVSDSDKKDAGDSGHTNNDTSNSRPRNPSSVVNKTLDTSDYMQISAENLYEYGKHMEGQKVITAFEIADIDTSSGTLKADTSNNDGFMFSVVCYFSRKSIVEEFEDGDLVTVAGTVSEPSSIGSTVTLNNCTVIGLGEIREELTSSSDEQREHIEESIAAAEEERRDTYISQCETVKYSDVARNPDTYEGRQIKIHGKVIQISEGWFDTVTLRVSCDGDIWYVTYTRAEGESRILEDDIITCYGECSGVTSYTTVVGAKVTIPSMKMLYYT